MTRRNDPASGWHARASAAGAAGALPARFRGPTAPDLLSDALRTVRLKGALFFVWEAGWPYVTPVPDGAAFAPVILPGAQQIISYHIVTDGSGWSAVAGQAPVPLEPGDVLLVPHGDAYAMSNAVETCAASEAGLVSSLEFFRRMAAGELPFVVREGGDGAGTTRFVCGFLGCDVRPFNPVLAALPALVRVRPRAHERGRLQALIDYTLAEAREPQPGGHCVLLQLSELLFVEVIRRLLVDLPADQGGWLSGLRHPVVGRALMLLHRQPAEAWSLERLARAVGMSRSRFAECFTRVVGLPPMQYLAQWRIQLGARLLADGRTKVAAAAREVGYESEAAFSRAFKRLVGVPPASWRHKPDASFACDGSGPTSARARPASRPRGARRASRGRSGSAW